MRIETENEEALDKAGADGWELVTAYHREYWEYGNECADDKFVFKREIEQK